MTNILQSVALALGAKFDDSQFEFDHSVSRGYITMPDGVKFFVVSGDYHNKDKISIRPSYPYHIENVNEGLRHTEQRAFDNSLSYPDNGFAGIKVSNTKSAEQIAKDITRRFLPVYTPLYAMALEFCKARKEHFSKQGYLESLAKELLVPFSYNGESSFKISIRNVSSGTVCIQIDNLDEKTLRDLAEALKNI